MQLSTDVPKNNTFKRKSTVALRHSRFKPFMKKITIDKKTKNDIILTASTIVLAAVVFFIIGLTAKDGDFVEVTLDGKITASYSLKEDRTVRLENGDSYNLLVIKNREAYIESASCPDKICVRGGKISKNGEGLVCLPNKTVITVHSESEKETDF